MNGRNINIYLRDDLHKKLFPWIKERKVSKFINEAVAEKLQKHEQQEKEKFEKELAEAYKRTAKSKTMKAEAKIWERTIEDGIDDEY